MKVTLSLVSGPQAGQAKVFEEPDFFIVGRLEECHYHLPHDPFLSRRHFLLEINPPDVSLRDLGSMNGTIINGVKHGGRAPAETEDLIYQGRLTSPQVVKLKDGDMLKVGITEIRIDISTSAPSAISEASTPATESGEAEPRGENARAERENLLRALAANEERRSTENPGALVDTLLRQLLRAEQALSAQSGKLPSIGDFQILRQLGKGCFGSVYKAIAGSTGREVALKTMLQTNFPEEKNLGLFRGELEILKSLKHPNTATFDTYGEFGGIHYLSCDLMDGGSVWDLMHKGNKSIAIEEAVPIMLQTLEGLSYAHKRKILHGDLKPSNILLSRREGKLHARVSDFCLARSFRKAGMTKNMMTTTGDFCGAAAYLAPEHITDYRVLRSQTDVFEIAAVFCHMITRKSVWDTTQEGFINEILQGDIKPVREMGREIPAGIARVLDRALDREIDKRYRDATSMLEDLRRSV